MTEASGGGLESEWGRRELVVRARLGSDTDSHNLGEIRYDSTVTRKTFFQYLGRLIFKLEGLIFTFNSTKHSINSNIKLFHGVRVPCKEKLRDQLTHSQEFGFAWQNRLNTAH